MLLRILRKCSPKKFTYTNVLAFAKLTRAFYANCTRNHLYIVFTRRQRFLKSKTKGSPKFLSSSGIRDGIFISVYNFTAQKRASFGNQSILNFRVVAVRGTKLRSHLSKNIYLSHDL